MVGTLAPRGVLPLRLRRGAACRASARRRAPRSSRRRAPAVAGRGAARRGGSGALPAAVVVADDGIRALDPGRLAPPLELSAGHLEARGRARRPARGGRGAIATISRPSARCRRPPARARRPAAPPSGTSRARSGPFRGAPRRTSRRRCAGGRCGRPREPSRGGRRRAAARSSAAARRRRGTAGPRTTRGATRA